MPGKIFINYRRDNAIAAAGRLHDRLAQAFGRANLFMDVDHIPAGVDFVTYLGEQVAQCDVFLAVMAPGWGEAQDDKGARRIDSPDDFVAIEIAAALARNVRVIPVLIDGARMPAMAELPASLQQLARRNAVEVRNSQFGRDADVLIEKIREAMKAAAVQARKPRPVASVPWGWVGSTAASVLMLGYVGAYYAGVPVWWPVARVSDPPGLTPATVAKGPAKVSDPEGLTSSAAATAKAGEAERQRVAAVEAEKENKRLAELAAQTKRDQEARQKVEAETAAKRKAEEDAARARADAELKRKSEEAERLRLAALKAEDGRQRAEAEAKRKADEEAKTKTATASSTDLRAAPLLRGLYVPPDPVGALVPGSGQAARNCWNDGQGQVCGPEMVVVPAGSFMMGSNDNDSEKPPRTVTIRHPFAVGKFEVTFDEWAACAAGSGCTSNRNPSDNGWGRGHRPVINVSWHDAKEYVAWLSLKTGNAYRLLSEAEWEYAARAGTTTRFNWGDEIGRDNATCNGCRSKWDNKQTSPVGYFRSNAFGLFDMHGNVWEWVEDAWRSNYNGAPSDGSVWQGGGPSIRIARGGAWSTYPELLSSSYRLRGISHNRFNFGIRVARTL